MRSLALLPPPHLPQVLPCFVVHMARSRIPRPLLPALGVPREIDLRYHRMLQGHGIQSPASAQLIQALLLEPQLAAFIEAGEAAAKKRRSEFKSDKLASRATSHIKSAATLSMGAQIGSGTFGTVFRAKWQGFDVAVKQLNKVDGKASAALQKEAMIMMGMSSPNIVRVFGMVDHPLGIIMVCIALVSLVALPDNSSQELVSSGSLHERLRPPHPPLSAEQRMHILRGVAYGLLTLHLANLVHLDVKPANILLALLGSEIVAKLTDFGISRSLDPLSTFSASTMGGAGSLMWMAPELHKCPAVPSIACDVYAFGMVMYELYAGHQPWEAELRASKMSPLMVPSWVVSGKRPSIPNHVPQHVATLMQRCWDSNPAKRPTLTDVIDALSIFMEHDANLTFWSSPPTPAPKLASLPLSSVMLPDALSALDSAVSDAAAISIAYYDDVEFAAQLCDEAATENRTNVTSVPLEKAQISLQNISKFKPPSMPLKITVKNALTDAESLLQADPGLKALRQKNEDAFDKEARRLRDGISQAEQECQNIATKLQDDENDARSSFDNNMRLLEQRLGVNTAQIDRMKDEEARALAANDLKGAQDANARLKAYNAACYQRVQDHTFQRKDELAKQLQQLRAVARDAIAAGQQAVAAKQSTLDSAVAGHHDQLRDFDASNASLVALISRAQKLLDREPSWPQHEALLRFDLQLQRHTTDMIFFKKWFPRYFCLRRCRLYYSDGKHGHPDTLDGTLAFMRSNPKLDGRYCVDLQGMLIC
jgi:serine/threonine protein kinase